MRLVDADIFDRENGIEHTFQLCRLYRRLEHLWRAVGQYRGPNTGSLQSLEYVSNLRKGIKREIERHQPVAKAWPVDAKRFQCKVEGVPGHLPEVRVSSLGRSQPRVLKLLVAPQRR